MQTFLPYKSVYISAECLDNKRLGKQRVEALQILNILGRIHENRELNIPVNVKTIPWSGHPAVKMWKGYEKFLKFYFNACVLCWINRGFKNTLTIFPFSDYKNYIVPHWLTEEFCNSHKSNLLRKDYAFYSKYNWNVENNLPYIWPVE